ncbi:hypothetical protein ACI2KT_36375, partial [Ensifer adhaerens]|uniref:hypothetical protein n=1 Tax=Ensifer adhaerens TaxID=106592 RepID=UPI00384B5C10
LVMVSPVSGIYAKVRQKFHLSPLFKFPEPALLTGKPRLHQIAQVHFLRPGTIGVRRIRIGCLDGRRLHAPQIVDKRTVLV